MAEWSSVRINRWLEKEGAYLWLADEDWFGVKYKHNWKCVFGHLTLRSFENVRASIRRSKGNACIKCKVKYQREEMVRFAFEVITGEAFPKQKPDWLVDPDTGNLLELDGYCEKLEMAFEHDGKQHEVHIDYFHSNPSEFEDQKRRDEAKDKICSEKGVMLIRVRQDEDFVINPSILVKKIQDKRSDVIKKTSVSWDAFDTNNQYELLARANSHAKKHGGRCNSKIIHGVNDKVEFYCPIHKLSWNPQYKTAIERNQWCKLCGHVTRAKKQSMSWDREQIEDICGSADPKINIWDWAGKDEKGRCLWRCRNEECQFPFKMSVSEVIKKVRKRKKPCPSCNKRRRIPNWERHQYAESKGGKCLNVMSDDAGEAFFSCHNHEHSKFPLTKVQFKGGNWCPECPDRKRQKHTQKAAKSLAEKHGYTLVGEYKNNTTPLSLKCVKCGRGREDVNYRQLQGKNKKLICHYCE